MDTKSFPNKINFNYSIIGAGKVASAVALKLQNDGLLKCVYYKNPKREKELLNYGIDKTKITNKFEHLLNSNCIIIAVNDYAIVEVVEKLIFLLENQSSQIRYIFHTSGLVTAKVLKPLVDSGFYVFAAHPVQTFFNPNKDLLKGITWSVENYNTNTEIIKEIINDLEGVVQFLPNNISDRKELYHLLSVVASNFVTTTIEFSKLIAKDLKIEDISFLSQLIKTTIENCIQNLNHNNMPLTGPLARKDYNAIKIYLDKISNPAHMTILINYLTANLEILFQKGIYNTAEKSKLEKIIRKYQ